MRDPPERSLSLSSGGQLDFGRIAVRERGGGSMSIDPRQNASARSNGGVIVLPSARTRPARFDVTSDGNRRYACVRFNAGGSLGSLDLRLELDGEPSLQGSGGYGICDRLLLTDGSGCGTIFVGGTLRVGANPPRGTQRIGIRVESNYLYRYLDENDCDE